MTDKGRMVFINMIEVGSYKSDQLSTDNIIYTSDTLEMSVTPGVTFTVSDTSIPVGSIQIDIPTDEIVPDDPYPDSYSYMVRLSVEGDLEFDKVTINDKEGQSIVPSTDKSIVDLPVNGSISEGVSLMMSYTDQDLGSSITIDEVTVVKSDERDIDSYTSYASDLMTSSVDTVLTTEAVVESEVVNSTSEFSTTYNSTIESINTSYRRVTNTHDTVLSRSEELVSTIKKELNENPLLIDYRNTSQQVSDKLVNLDRSPLDNKIYTTLLDESGNDVSYYSGRNLVDSKPFIYTNEDSESSVSSESLISWNKLPITKELTSSEFIRLERAKRLSIRATVTIHNSSDTINTDDFSDEFRLSVLHAKDRILGSINKDDLSDSTQYTITGSLKITYEDTYIGDNKSLIIEHTKLPAGYTYTISDVIVLKDSSPSSTYYESSLVPKYIITRLSDGTEISKDLHEDYIQYYSGSKYYLVDNTLMEEYPPDNVMSTDRYSLPIDDSYVINMTDLSSRVDVDLAHKTIDHLFNKGDLVTVSLLAKSEDSTSLNSIRLMYSSPYDLSGQYYIIDQIILPNTDELSLVSYTFKAPYSGYLGLRFFNYDDYVSSTTFSTGAIIKDISVTVSNRYTPFLASSRDRFPNSITPDNAGRYYPTEVYITRSDTYDRYYTPQFTEVVLSSIINNNRRSGINE